MEKALFCVTSDNLKVALAASVLKSQKNSDNQTLEILQMPKKGISAFYWSVYSGMRHGRTADFAVINANLCLDAASVLPFLS